MSTSKISNLEFNSFNAESILNSDSSYFILPTVFIPEAPDGTTTVTLTFNTTGFTEEDTVVVFETIYDIAEDTESQTEDVVIAEHADLNDMDQSIRFVLPDIPATGEEVAINTVIGLLLIAGAITSIVVYTKKKK